MQKKSTTTYGGKRFKPKLTAAFISLNAAVENEYKTRRQELAEIEFRELKKQSQKK